MLRALYELDFLSRQGKNQRESGVLGRDVLITRSPGTGESVLHAVNEYFELIFNAVLREKTFVQSSHVDWIRVT